jgi:tripartite-type tricarboxylate transporter receptor subunit TctC
MGRFSGTFGGLPKTGMPPSAWGFKSACALMVSGLALSWSAAAQADPADFYRGKTVEILVGFSAGGGYDAYARALARSIGNHIPGKPQIVVRNFTGAGSLRLARYLQDAAPRDGLSFGTFDNALLVSPLVKDGVNFDPSKLSWIGTVSTEMQICVLWEGGRVKSIDDLRKTDTVFGATGRDDVRYISADILRKVVGAKLKIVTGYPGTADIRLALEKGEVDGECESWQSLKGTKMDWVTGHKVNTVVQFGTAISPELPGVPPITDFARSATEKDALKLIFSGAEAGRPFAGPPNIPADRLDALRRAFDATMKDAEFLSVMKAQNLDMDPRTGEKAEAFLRRAYASPPAVIETARKLLND